MSFLGKRSGAKQRERENDLPEGTAEEIIETESAQTEGDAPQGRSAGVRGKISGAWRKLGKKGRRIVAVVLVVAIVAGIGLHFLGGKKKTNGTESAYTTAEVTYRDISSEITGSGTLEAADSYSVTSLLEATILSDTFEEGDQVEKDAVLYTLDSSDADSSLEQAEISLNQAQRNYSTQLDNQAKLTVTAPVAGQVISIDVEEGDDVNAGQTLATVRDSATMSLTVNFPASEAKSFYVGQSATVTLDSTFETLTGKISKINGSDTVLTGNVIVRAVTIDVTNPGGLSTSQQASAAVGSVTSSDSGTFEYKEEKTITAEVSGTVESIAVSEGAKVSEGQTILQLSSDSVEDSVQSAQDNVRNAELSLENQTDKLDDYTITSPISGTIVDKYYKTGETTEANKTLCTIYDLSYLTMTLSVDELDIANIKVGQTVTVTADAVEDQTYEGVVTKVSVAGTSSSGVTTYPVTIRIDETDGLLPGMSADATISLESASNVLAIPSAALQRGNTVLITKDSPSAANAIDNSETPTGAPDVSGTAGSDDDAAAGAAAPSGQTSGSDTANSDYVTVEVTIGVSDDNYTEILSGLQEGDVVVYLPTSSSSSEMTMDFSMDVGEMPSGGSMPSGGGTPGGGF